MKESRKELIRIADEVEAQLPTKERVDSNNRPLSPEANDRKWADRYQPHIINHVKKALSIQEANQEKETPVALLDAALRKLNHEAMVVQNITTDDYGKARQLAADIQARAHEIEQEVYGYKKKLDALAKKSAKSK